MNFNQLFLQKVGLHEVAIFKASAVLGLYKKRKLRIAYTIQQFIYLLLILLRSLRTGKKEILFLSYELVSMSLASHIFNLFKRNVYLVEHNTLVPKNSVKLRLFKSISKAVCHIALEEYISIFIKEDLQRNAVTVNHPIQPCAVECISRESKKRSDVFMPSSTIDKAVVNEICDTFALSSSNKAILYLKGDENLSSENIVYKPHYTDYEERICGSSYVIIPQIFEYRVSGVFYDAIAGSSTILMSDCIFAQNMRLRYGKRVVILKDWSKLSEVIFDE